jgi:hypothetical protein
VAGSRTLDPLGLLVWVGGADSVTVVWVRMLAGREYVDMEFLSIDSFGGLGKAKDSEGENGRTDIGVRISPSIKPLFATVRYCAYESLFWLWTLFALCTENRLVLVLLLLADGIYALSNAMRMGLS